MTQKMTEEEKKAKAEAKAKKSAEDIAEGKAMYEGIVASLKRNRAKIGFIFGMAALYGGQAAVGALRKDRTQEGS